MSVVVLWTVKTQKWERSPSRFEITAEAHGRST